MIVNVSLRLLYLVFYRVTGWLILLTQNDSAKEVERSTASAANWERRTAGSFVSTTRGPTAQSRH